MTTMTCGAAGCAADAVEGVPYVPMVARTRDDPEYVASAERVPMCSEHAVVMRQKAMAPYLGRIITTQKAAADALTRMGLASPGQASTDDLAVVRSFVSDTRELALITEDAKDPQWLAAAAQVEAMATAMEAGLRRHTP